MIDIDLSLISDPVVREGFQKLIAVYETNPFLMGEWEFFNGHTGTGLSDYKIRHGFGFVPQDVFITWVSNDAKIVVKFDEIDKEWLVFETDKKCSFRVVAGRLA